MRMNMTPERYDQVRELFIEVCELDATARSAVLNDRCAGDADLRREVEALLAAERDQYRDQDNPLRESRLGIMAEVVHAAAEGNAEIIGTLGKYRVIRKIGAGGMGAVYEAEQDYPRRTVALKVMRPGVSREKMARRFAHEAHVLGLLQHPGIAQIYDAGTADTAGGVQPYFVMEMVRGQPLTDYVESRNLSTRSRLALMAQVAEAVHHAHTKGVVHRDLKPGNILVVQENGEEGSGHPARLQPKVLDFGVASATDSDVMATTLHTDIGQLIGTVPYMSPEQASGDADQIDTRSDVYSLGVVCYELLAHRLPHDLRHAKVHEAVRVIREEDPVKLSSVDRTFRGDVETIVGKALEKDKERRYQSAADFAADIRRYLNDEPIQARPSSAMYQLRKFARRNKALVGGAMAVVLALIAGVATTTYWLMEALEQRNRARELGALAAERLEASASAHKRATIQGEVSGAVRDFLSDLLKSADPSVAQGQSLTVADILDDASSNLKQSHASREVVSELYDIIGVSYYGLGRYDTAIEHLRVAVEIRDRDLGREDPRTIESVHNLAAALGEYGATDEALQLCDDALAAQMTIGGANHAASLSLVNLRGTLMHDQHLLAEAKQLYSQALEGRRATLGDNHEDTISSYHNLASVLADEGDLAGAENMYRIALDGERTLWGDDHPRTLFTLRNLGNCLRRSGQLPEAETVLNEAVQRSRRVLGDEHHQTATSMNNLGLVYQDQGRLADAEGLFRSALGIVNRNLSPDHPAQLAALNNLARVLDAQRKYEEAERLYTQVLDLHARGGNLSPERLKTLNNLGMMYSNMERYADADPLLREVTDIRRRTLGLQNMDTLNALANLALNLRRSKQPDAAIAIYEDIASNAAAIALPTDWRPDAWRAAHARCLVDLRRFDEAEPMYLSALSGLQAKLGSEHTRTIQVIHALIDLYEYWEKPEEVAKLRATLPAVDNGAKPH